MSAEPQGVRFGGTGFSIPSFILASLKERVADPRRRDRHEIVAEILETARGGLIKTHLMYKARLSWYQLDGFLPLLVEKGLLENLAVRRNRRPTVVWKTTEQGRRFLENYRLLDV